MTEAQWNDLASQAYRESKQAEDAQWERNKATTKAKLWAYQQGFEAGWRNAIATARKAAHD